MVLRFFLLCLFLFLPEQLYAADVKKDFLAEALIARVGRDAITYSDLMRFQHVEEIMSCAGLRVGSGVAQATENFDSVLSRYIEEELIYAEARTKKNTAKSMLSDAVKTIQSRSKCQKDWRDLGKKYATVWSTKSRPLEGEGILVRELEKRLVIDNFAKTQIQGERSIWLREQKVKVPIKLYLE